MTFFDSVIMGIVEGLTEFLPISSTAHLIITAKLLNLAHTDYMKSFEISIQTGAILAVVVMYWKELFTNMETVKRLIVTFIPTGALGFAFYKVVKGYLLGNGSVIAWAFVIGGVVLIAFEMLHREKDDAIEEISRLPYAQCVMIGFFQALAMIPGVSRSGITIIGGLLLGLRRRLIVEFSFLLAVPTMFSATAYDLYKSGGAFSLEQFGSLAAGFVMSFIVAMGCIKFFLRYIRRHTFIPFGVYRIIAGAALLAGLLPS
ncbi:MAG: undecaprenyl-diphosphate phosphatase [Nitrospinae bacterium]|nr:undecaprenyl-diphosphate phosphatase [Nitrospinota bacterium]